MNIKFNLDVVKFLNRKSYRDLPDTDKKKQKILEGYIDLNYVFSMPENIKDLIRKYKDKKFTIDLYEKYKVYKASTKFTKQNI